MLGVCLIWRHLHAPWVRPLPRHRVRLTAAASRLSVLCPVCACMASASRPAQLAFCSALPEKQLPSSTRLRPMADGCSLQRSKYVKPYVRTPPKHAPPREFLPLGAVLRGARRLSSRMRSMETVSKGNESCNTTTRYQTKRPRLATRAA